VAAHEAAYLEHCRRHALKDGALKEFLEPKGPPR
jgi:hypothetical protein